MLDEFDRSVMAAFRGFLEHVRTEAIEADGLSPVGERIQSHLGADPREIPHLVEQFNPSRIVDMERAFAALASDGEVFGVGGGDLRRHAGVADVLRRQGFPIGPVDYVARPDGVSSTARCVSFGVRLGTFEGKPFAVVQRAPDRDYGRSELDLTVLIEGSGEQLLDRIRALMDEHSSLRGAVLELRADDHGGSSTRFQARPTVLAGEVVLPDGVLGGIRRHVIGIGEQRASLLAAGQHLKRGVLLYGPPGTGKTLTVRHLIGEAREFTIITMQGAAIAFVQQAAQLARTFQPAIVVLEDIDLVAMERTHSPEPLLYQVLDAVDGLAGDADIAFVMTTNRVEVLERALAQRPGRVDFAAEIPLPEASERARLFALYARGLPFTDASIERAAARAEGTTGSFAKELIRRAVLTAALADESLGDEHLFAALDELLDDAARLTRSMLGSHPHRDGEVTDEPGEASLGGSDTTVFTASSFGWSAGAPLPMRPDRAADLRDDTPDGS